MTALTEGETGRVTRVLPTWSKDWFIQQLESTGWLGPGKFQNLKRGQGKKEPERGPTPQWAVGHRGPHQPRTSQDAVGTSFHPTFLAQSAF